MESKVKQKLGQAIRELLLEQQVVRIEGLGKFERIHIKQHQEQRSNGQVELMPPKDIIEFTAE
ncbi:MAG: HU family DNA-binding protein [Bacteroidota bacterium]